MVEVQSTESIEDNKNFKSEEELHSVERTKAKKEVMQKKKHKIQKIAKKKKKQKQKQKHKA